MFSRWLLITIKHSQALVLNKSIVLHRKKLIGHAHSSLFVEWHNLGITIIKHAICSTNICQKFQQNQIITNFIYPTSSNLVTISHELFRRRQFLEKFMEILERSAHQK